MNEKKEKLIKSVKDAVAKYGLSGISTRNIAEEAGVNDAYIYHFFKDKEELLLEAYMYENGQIFTALLNAVDDAHNLDIPFAEKAFLSFSKTWRYFLDNSDRLIFCVFYYHSEHFENATEYHNGQLKDLQERIGGYFPSEEICKQTMHALCTMLYDSSYSVISGKENDTEEYARRVFEMEMAMLKSQISYLPVSAEDKSI